MPGLMDFLEPFATGYLETKITGQEKRAEAIQKANELADAKLAEIAKNRAIQLDNLEIENADLEEKRSKEEEQLLKQHEDMNPVVLKYLQDQNYFYDKATWTAFSEEFKKQAGGSDKWYQQDVVGSGGKSWQEMMADQLNKSFNKDDAKNAVDLPTNTKNLVMDFSVKDQPFSLLNPKSLNPMAIIDYNKAQTELSKSETELTMLNFDEQNQEVIFNLDKESKEVNNQLNSLAVQSKEYDLKTQPKKDLINMQIKQADLLTANINNASLRQKNTLTINQMQTNIDRVKQTMSIAEQLQDINLQKAELQVDNLRLEIQMNDIMIGSQPEINSLKIHGMQLDNAKKLIENETFGDQEKQILENIRLRNDKLLKDAKNYDEKTANDIRQQNLEIELLQKKMDESPNVNMLSQGSIRQEAENAVGDAIGVPKSTDRFGTLQFNYETFNAPWIKNATSNAFDETSNLVQEYQNLIKTDSNFAGVDTKNININNIAKRLTAEKIKSQYEKDLSYAINMAQKEYIEKNKQNPSKEISTQINQAILNIFQNKKIEESRDILKDYKIKNQDFFRTKDDGKSSDSYYTPAMNNLIFQLGQGKYSKENDILKVGN